MSETKRAITELNAGLVSAFVDGDPFKVGVNAEPALYVDYERHEYRRYSLLEEWAHRRPYTIGEIAIVGFAAQITRKSDILVGAYALGGVEPQLATLGYRVENPAILLAAAQHAGLDAQQASHLYLPPRA